MADTIKELTGTLRAGEATTLRAELADALAGGDLLITTAGLTEIDCSIVQVLLSAGQTAAQLERKLQIEMADGGALAVMLGRLAVAQDPALPFAAQTVN